MEPKIYTQKKKINKTCGKCGLIRSSDMFIQTRSWIHSDGCCPICNDCIKGKLKQEDFNWQVVDELCQFLNLPFLPSKFEELRRQHGDDVFPIYAKMFLSSEYEHFGWSDYFNRFKELKTEKLEELEMPRLKDEYFQELRTRWSSTYDDEQLLYLEGLYNGLLKSQNINGALQEDQAKKLCKMSLQIDERIAAGMDIDKLMGSYERMTKVANITPKNSKGDSDFSSFGEVVCWLEKRKWLNPAYDDANRDIVDEVIHSNQAFVQRLYTNETGLAEEIEERINNLKIAAELEKKGSELDKKRFSDNIFEIDEVDLEKHDNEAYEDLIVDDVLTEDTVKV